jgi:Tfp pilus assembly PilM family ATPase
MRKNNEVLSVVGADIIDMPAREGETDETEALPLLTFSSQVKAHYASLSIDSGPAVIRLLTLPGKDDADLDDRVVDNLGLENPEDFRISYTLLSDGGGRTETRLVAVAYPDHLVAAALGVLPASGTPAPYSVEVAGLATMTAFLNGPVTAREKDTLGLIEFGETSSLFAFFHRGTPVLIRKLDRGTNALLDKVEATLGVNRETALGIISDGSFDISAAAAEVMQPLIRQLVVSRDFVERRENCRVDAIYLAGGLAVSRDTQNEVSSAMGVAVESWNPFEGLTVADDAVPDALKGQEWRFAASVGACMATFEE